MKKRIDIIPAALGLMLAGAMASCDHVDEAERFIPVERPEVSRVVLVQEFTGMSCVNCPNGAAQLHNLQEQFPGSVIVVGLHPYNNINTTPLRGLDLRSETATVYADYFKPEAFPAAMVNNGPVLLETNLWPTSAVQAMAVPASLELTLEPSYDAETRELTVSYEALFNKVVDQTLDIALLVTESGIHGMQKTTEGNGFILDYTFNHVLRGSMNGAWGESLGSSFVTEQSVTGSATMTLPEAWVAENCDIVGVVMQSGSKAVEQAATVPVTGEPEEE